MALEGCKEVRLWVGRLAASEHEVLVAIFEALRDGKTVSAVEN